MVHVRLFLFASTLTTYKGHFPNLARTIFVSLAHSYPSVIHSTFDGCGLDHEQDSMRTAKVDGLPARSNTAGIEGMVTTITKKLGTERSAMKKAVIPISGQ